MCELCAGEHPTDQCAINSVAVQFIGSYNRPLNPYQNTYNLGARNHPNFLWSNNQNQQQSPRPLYPPGFQNQHQQSAPQHEKKSDLEELLLKYISGNEATMKT